jgi:hypothetical protein
VLEENGGTSCVMWLGLGRKRKYVEAHFLMYCALSL